MTTMRRILLYVGGRGVDLALPGDVPVGDLLPAVHDLLTRSGLCPPGAARLAQPGHEPLDESKTLLESEIRDGVVLTMLSAGPPPRAPVVIDAAVAVAAVAQGRWLAGPLVARRMGATLATILAGVVGCLVVPGGPGVPDVLLASAAVAATAVLAARAVGDPVGIGAAVACAAGLCSTAALAGTLRGVTLAEVGIALAVLSLALLTSSARLSVLAAGLTSGSGVGVEPRAVAARRRMGILTAGSAAAAAVGVVTAVRTDPGWATCALGVAVFAVLVLRARAHPDPLPAGALIACGTLTLVTLLVSIQLGWWPCLIAALLGLAAARLAASSGQVRVPPAGVRVLGGVELAALVAVAPLACWAVGAFDAVLP
jgi:hypothetical protein